MAFSQLKRREFIGLVGGAAAVWPCAARAQAVIKRIGVLMGGAKDGEGQADFEAFRLALRELNWIEGQNLQIDDRWAGADTEAALHYAGGIIASKPDVIFVNGIRALIPLRNGTRTIPIVFVSLTDPVSQGFVQSLARPGGNLTGFTLFEFSVMGKLLEIIKQTAPQIEQAALLFHPDLASSAIGYMHALEAVAPALSVQPFATPVRNKDEIVHAIDSIAGDAQGALLIPPDLFAEAHRELIVQSTAAKRVPAIYALRSFVTSGGLMSYGTDMRDLFGRAASYVDRILKGETPSELPVQAPVKFDLRINLRTANALRLTVPQALLAIADEVIE